MIPEEKTWKDLQGKSFQERLDIRFNGWKPACEKDNCLWWLYSYITAGRDYGFQLIKKDGSYYLETYEESGYANGIVVAGPLDENQAERITDCFQATKSNYNDDPS